MLVIPNKAKIPGEKTKYKLTGNDHKNAINNRSCFDIKEATIAKQAGRNNMKNVFTTGANSVGFE